MSKINTIGIYDNLVNIVSILVGMTILRVTGKRYGKEARGTTWLNIASANNAANGHAVVWFPYRMVYNKKGA